MAQAETAVDYEVLDNVCESEGIDNTKLKILQKLRNLQRQKKLCLILDLDQTLIHSTVNNRGNKLFKKTATSSSLGNADDIFEHKVGNFKCLTKLRPFVQEFLKEASKLFEMYIYTLGTRNYAMRVVNVLDPEGLFFGTRIISSQESTKKNKKSLDVLPDVDESFVLILDDLEQVWSRYSRNLILVKQYVYFDRANKAFIDETEGSRALSCALKVLKEVHTLYFKRDDLSVDCDVRDLLEIVLKNSSEGI